MEETENKNTEKQTEELPLIPLDEVLDCMKDKDYIISLAGKRYYEQHYLSGR